MDESVSTVERETVQQHSSAKPRVEARVEEALKRLAELRKGMPPIDAVTRRGGTPGRSILRGLTAARVENRQPERCR